ncbi:ATP-binding protein [candidate division KSB1 bacterium]|nr:ATP-binding protein [candidate division KSB1 bacterium]
MKSKFKRDIQSLTDIFNFIEKFANSYQIDGSISFAINLAVDELFTNMVNYHTENPNDILISLTKQVDRIVVTLIDYEVEPYDINKSKEYDTTMPLEDRKPGGIGIHLVKKFVDEIDYTYQERNSKITLVKYLEKHHVRD